MAVYPHKRRKWGQWKPTLGFQLDTSHPLATRLVALWIFNEGGGTGHDLVQGRIGTPSGDVKFTAGIDGPTLTTAGSGFVDCGASDAFDVTTGDFTVAVRAAWTGTGTVGFPVCRTNGSNTNGYDMLLGRLATGGVSWRLNSGNLAVIDSPATAWNDGKYHTLVGMRQGGVASLWIDGVSQGTVAAAANLSDSGMHLNVFGRANSAFFTGGGKADNLGFWSRAISAAEIQQLYAEPYAMVLGPTVRRTYSVPAAGGGHAYAWWAQQRGGILGTGAA